MGEEANRALRVLCQRSQFYKIKYKYKIINISINKVKIILLSV